MEAFGKIYEQHIERARQRPPLPEDVQRYFTGRVRQFFISAALPGGHPKQAAEQFIADINAEVGDEGLTLDLQGLDDVAGADLYLGNHQGPQGDSGPQGGFETMMSWPNLPDNIRFVFRKDLASRWTLSFRKWITATVLQKADPIGVEHQGTLQQLPKTHASQSEKKPIVDAFRKDRLRVANEIIKSVESGRPVMMYPEGQRSASGRLLPFVSDYCDRIVEYIAAKMKAGTRAKIALLPAETLQVMPEGIMNGALLRPGTAAMHAMMYDTGFIEAKIAQTDLSDTGVVSRFTMKQLGRELALDMRRTFEKKILSIVQHDMA
jgi:hypothetical protein